MFAAVVQQGAQRALQSIEFDRDPRLPLETTLTNVGLQLLRNSRRAIVVTRGMLGEANRFPILARALYEHAVLPTRNLIAEILTASTTICRRRAVPGSAIHAFRRRRPGARHGLERCDPGHGRGAPREGRPRCSPVPERGAGLEVRG